MAYYVIRVAPNQEQVFLQLSQRLIDHESVSVVYPRRRMEHRKGGKRFAVEVALFPGYVFLHSDQGVPADLYARIKTIPRFTFFLRQGDEIAEVKGKDLDLLQHFLKFGEVTPKSLVTFDENQRIKVLSGPMVGMEGQIVHVDRRKRRAKILLNFDHGSFTVTLGFEMLDGSTVQAAPA